MSTSRQAKEEPDDGGCVFCVVPQTESRARPRATASSAYVVLNKFPYNPGHLLVVPLRHVGDLEERDRRRERRARRCCCSGRSRALRADVGAARVQRGPEPRARSRARGSPSTCTGTSCRAGAATRTSCRSWARPGCCRSCSPTPYVRLAAEVRLMSDARSTAPSMFPRRLARTTRSPARARRDADPPRPVGLAHVGSAVRRCWSDAAFRVLRYDVRGYGRSSRLDGERRTRTCGTSRCCSTPSSVER